MINGWPLGKNKMKYVYKFHNFIVHIIQERCVRNWGKECENCYLKNGITELINWSINHINVYVSYN
jgi:hypothetical protein